jgi:DNA polymerase-4/DNA polymerase V
MERAIIHFDGDSFFASVEQVMNHRLRGLPVVTGGERGAITAVSIEGKRLGVTRGTPLREARIICPNLVVVTSDYTSYSIFAHRMYSIVREFTPKVEEYSIDECFADVTGLDQKYGMSYPDIARMIKAKLEANLGLTFGVGLGPNKVIAKAASKHRKPAGFTHVPTADIPDFIRDISVGKLWGIGSSTSIQLGKLGIRTALDLAQKDERWLFEHSIVKPVRLIWHELRGGFAKPLNHPADDDIGSIIKSRTFNPPSSDRAFVLSQLSKNIEGACIKARRHGVKAGHARFYLKTQQFTYRAVDFTLTNPIDTPSELLRIVERRFDEAFVPGTTYRATGISLSALVPKAHVSGNLFGNSVDSGMSDEKSAGLFTVVDDMSRKYGSGTVFLASSLGADQRKGWARRIDPRALHERLIMKGDRQKKTLDIPFLGKAR